MHVDDRWIDRWFYIELLGTRKQDRQHIDTRLCQCVRHPRAWHPDDQARKTSYGEKGKIS